LNEFAEGGRLNNLKIYLPASYRAMRLRSDATDIYT